ncbi:MAG: response regulator [Myxococcales bacterium]|nr:response regulator [Myxococcales bacterium]
MDPDFRALFESAPGLYLVLALDPPRFTVVAASDRYLEATMTTRDRILGCGLFEVFPDNPSDPHATGVANLRESLERVVRERVPDTMAVQRYDIRKPGESQFEERFWSPTNWPVIGPGGELRSIIHRVEDVTDFVRARADDREQVDRLRVEVFQRAQELQEANRGLRALQDELEQRVLERTAALQRTEAQLRHAQKLEAIGRLAGGVAHDFNNLLTVILGGCDFLMADLGDLEQTRANVEDVRKAGLRAADLTRQLLAFSRQQVVSFEVLVFDEVVRNLERMLRRLVGADVQLTTTLGADEAAVFADRGQLEQVVMNLVVNARDALPKGGHLVLETSVCTLDEAYARDHVGVEPGRYLMLAVRDDGVGMDEATQSRIFEPFFTTKGPGKGTGLGLSTVFGIVQQCGGHIWLYSEPDLGTTFKVYLPRATAGVVATAPPIDPGLRGGTETILVTEDHEQVRAVAREILERAGYQVLSAAGPEEALRLVDEHGGVIDLLLTDVVMPGMNGRELADRVHARWPALRVLFMSGYTDDVVLRHGALDTRALFIEKPLTADGLLRKVRGALDSGKGA